MEKTKTNTWYAMEQEIDAEGVKSSKAEIFIYDEIGGFEVNANQFIGELENLGEVEQIDLRISSPGGSIIEGNVIFNAIKRHAANVTVYIDGMAASMASVIAMAGDEIIMADNALLMIHNPWTVSIGDSEQLRKDADLMDKMKSAIINAYGRSNYSEEELEELMDATTWFTAEEAMEAGFIDGTTEGLKAAASVSEMAAIASQAGATLPIEKIVAGIVTKHENQVEKLETEIFEITAKFNDSTVQIEELQNSVKEYTDGIEQMEKAHQEALVKTEEVTANKVAVAAAELMALQSSEAVAEASNETDKPVDADSFWTEYKTIGKTQGLEAKNKWFADNKHLLQK
jgi:ATP-dependent protease ClpP protease subunit